MWMSLGKLCECLLTVPSRLGRLKLFVDDDRSLRLLGETTATLYRKDRMVEPPP